MKIELHRNPNAFPEVERIRIDFSDHLIKSDSYLYQSEENHKDRYKTYSHKLFEDAVDPQRSWERKFATCYSCGHRFRTDRCYWLHYLWDGKFNTERSVPWCGTCSVHHVWQTQKKNKRNARISAALSVTSILPYLLWNFLGSTLTMTVVTWVVLLSVTAATAFSISFVCVSALFKLVDKLDEW